MPDITSASCRIASSTWATGISGLRAASQQQSATACGFSAQRRLTRMRQNDIPKHDRQPETTLSTRHPSVCRRTNRSAPRGRPTFVGFRSRSPRSYGARRPTSGRPPRRANEESPRDLRRRTNPRFTFVPIPFTPFTRDPGAERTRRPKVPRLRTNPSLAFVTEAPHPLPDSRPPSRVK